MFLPDNAVQNTFLVAELFTSQGCSSCPEADRQFGNLVTLADHKNLPVYGLSFHVNYWDRLGWKDPFGKDIFTERQRQYSHKFKLTHVYTPQIIINGRSEFVGSELSERNNLVQTTLQEPNSEFIEIKAWYKLLSDTLEVSYILSHPSNGIVNIALVQAMMNTKISAGENKGRTLTDHNIVRSFEQVDCNNKNKGTVILKKPHDLSASDFKIIIYLQNKIDMRIIGAARADFI